MAAEKIRIDELHLRVPGLSREEARQLGEEVALRLATDLRGSARSQHLGSLELRTTVAQGASRDELTRQIADAIRRALR
jgi:hypothetical protein